MVPLGSPQALQQPSKELPRIALEHQDLPRGTLELPRATQERPKSDPGATQDPQEQPKSSQERPKSPQERPQSPQERPKNPPSATQDLQEQPKSPQEQPRTLHFHCPTAFYPCRGPAAPGNALKIRPLPLRRVRIHGFKSYNFESRRVQRVSMGPKPVVDPSELSYPRRPLVSSKTYENLSKITMFDSNSARTIPFPDLYWRSRVVFLLVFRGLAFLLAHLPFVERLPGR